MTPEDASRTMRLLSAAWTYFPSSDDVARLWTAELAHLDADPARAAAKRLAETSDRMPSLAAFLRAVADESRFARLAASAPALAPGENTYPCRCGSWHGWEMVGDGNPPTLTPCRYCRPLTYEQWAAGHYASGHTCQECERRKRGAAA